jgi:predicted HD phosphohydrolase
MTPSGDAICVERDGDLVAVWREGQPDRWVASTVDHFAGTMADALGLDVGHDDVPEWISSFAQRVLSDLGAT